MPYDSVRALDLLKLGTGNDDAQFRDGQEEAIRHIVEGHARQFLVQKTGWGKSFVYFIATRLLREAGLGPTLLISPLLALMRNQIAAAERMGVHAETINSSNEDEWDRVENAARAGELDILLISPERLANERFRDIVLAEVAERIALLVIDEAHCISDWGHDFRPHYRLIERIVRTLPPNLRLLATTATANARVMDDLEQILGPNLDVMRGELNRPSLVLQTIRLSGQAERLAWLAERLPALPGSGIVYTLRFSDELVGACEALVREWNPAPSPVWVAAIPSLRHPQLVPDFARRLADALGLPFSEVLGKRVGRPEQKTMENSDRQARNVVGSLTVDKDSILPGAVLLVDDVVDSRWTLTVATWELRRRGCGPVWPLALASAGGRS